MNYKISKFDVPRGVSVAVLTALDDRGGFDARAQERLLEWVLQDGQGASRVFSSGTTGEWNRLPGKTLRRVNETCAWALGAAGAPGLWAGVSASSVEGLLGNLEHAVKIGAAAAVVAPLALEHLSPLQLFHRRMGPLFEKLGRGIPIILYDNADLSVGHQDKHLKTSDLKQLSRLPYVSGIKVSAGPKVVGNYLRAARHFNERHEFGVYLGNADALFSIFTPAQHALDNVRTHWNRLWLGAEMPHGAAVGSATLFPLAWRAAWEACLAGDGERIQEFRDFFKELSLAWRFGSEGKSQSYSLACMKLSLAELGVLSSPKVAPGTPELSAAMAKRWLKKYSNLKKQAAHLAGQEDRLPARGVKKKKKKALPLQSGDVCGLGGVVVDDIRVAAAIQGPDSKGLILKRGQLYPGGVILNQLGWAASLGLRAQMLGWGGSDEETAFLRAAMDKLGIDHRAFKTKKGSASVARIFVDPSGERAIYLEKGVSETITAAGIKNLAPVIQGASCLIAEVSLISLAAQLQAFKSAKAAGTKTFLDLDIPPRQAVGSQALGSTAQLDRLLVLADFLKCSMNCALQLVRGKNPLEVAKKLHKKLEKKQGHWVAVTQGAKGLALYDGIAGLRIAAVKAPKVLDSTGAGDAAMGALVAATFYALPLKDIGELAAAAGAACVAQMGASPDGPAARQRILKLYKGKSFAPQAWKPSPSVQTAQGPAVFMGRAVEELDFLRRRGGEGVFESALSLIEAQLEKGRRLHVTGVGKTEYVAGYIASSLSSTGTPAYFLHATEAGHGASGQVARGDVVIAISNSGETGELKAAVATLKRNGAKIIGCGGKPGSWLARQSEVFLFAGVRKEGDTLNMAPRASILAQVMILGALGVALQESRGFTAEEFRSFHPGGSLGKKS